MQAQLTESLLTEGSSTASSGADTARPEVRRLRAATSVGLCLLALACTQELPGEGAAKPSSDAAAPAPAEKMAQGAARAPAAEVQRPAGEMAARRAPLAGLDARSGELLNPDDSTMVLLYYELAGLELPLDQWVENDNRVRYARGAQKAALREQVRAQLQAAAAVVRGIGFIRLSMNAALSEYDPSYGEFTVGALAPSSVVSFDALGQKISLRFGNGRAAQIWAVPQAQAQAIQDMFGYSRNVSLDALLRINRVQPAPNGGSIVADVIEYELREASSRKLIGRVRVAAE